MKKTTNAIVILALAIAAGIWIYAVPAKDANTDSRDANKLQVGTSFYVLDEFVRTIGGEHIDVTVSPPAGVDIHSFEPTARQVATLQSVNLFLFQGAGVDAWAEDIAPELEVRGVRVIEINELLPLRSSEGDEHEDESHEDEAHQDDEHAHGAFDPHTWLDPVLAQTIVHEIAAALSELDPANANAYAHNAETLHAELEQLDTLFKTTLAQCETREIIVAHDAFGYIGARYDITMYSISGISPEEEPSANKMAELTDLAREHNIEYIFFEALTSPKTAETIANEVGAQILVLDPIEGVVTGDNRGYVEIMKENIQNLSTAMQCS